MEKIPEFKVENLKKSFFVKTIKIYLILFIIGCLSSISAVNSFSQSANISLKLSNVTLEELFSTIESETTYVILYKKGMIENKTVSVDSEDETVYEILSSVLPPLNLDYHINGKQIVVVEKEKMEHAPSQVSSNYKLNGIVVDKTGEPLIGVSIIVKGTTMGIATNSDGRFSLDVTPGFTLLAKFIGYKDEDVLITGQQDLKITLHEDPTLLDDVVVVGYGTQKKASVVGAVNTITVGDLRVPSTQLSTSFAGRLPGVISVQRSGQPGADGADFWIRGISTFGGRQTPLIVVDGMQVNQSDLNNIDPEVIESFSILKDATATALYGTLGANGVMIVTTKSGRDMDKPKINARFEASVSAPTNKPKFVGGVQFMQMYNEAQKNPLSSSYIPYSQEKIDRTIAGDDPLLYPNVDWYNELFKKAQFTERAVLNIMGGSKRVDYFTSVSASHEAGMLKSRSKEFTSYDNNIDLWRYNFQNNINIYPTSSTKLSVRLNVQLKDLKSPLVEENRDVNTLFNNVIQSNPVDFPILYPGSDTRNLSWTTDHTMWGGKIGTNTRQTNPLAELIRGYNTDFQSTVIAMIDLEQKLDFITPGLKFKGLISFKNWSRTVISRTSNYNQYFLGKTNTDADGRIVHYELERTTGAPVSEVLDINKDNSYGQGDRRMYIQAMFDYDRTFNKVHNLGIMALYNQEETNINTPGTLKNSLPYRKQGLAGRLTYSYDYRYLAEMNFGYNGSENFAKGKRFGFFPSVALGYNISQEAFWEKLKPVVSHMKIRGSWGLVGNDQTDNARFLYLADLNLSGISYTTGRGQGYTQSGPIYNRYQNNNLTWEIGEKINVGLDLQLFKDINLVFEVFQENRRNIFLERKSIPNFFGTAGTKLYGNLGKVQNKGFEASVDYLKAINKDWTINFKGSFTFAQNKIKAYDEPAFKLYPRNSRVGYSVNQQLLYVADRLFIDQAEINNSPLQTISGSYGPGDIKYIDMPDIYGTRDGKIDGNDRIYTGYPTVPEIVYGFGLSLQYLKWDFSMFFQGVARTSLVMSGFHPFGTAQTRNVLQFIANDYWSEDNQNIYAKYPRLSIVDNANNTAASTYWLRDAAFLKLKNAEIGYTFKFMRVYFNGSNLLTFSKFKEWDPEMGGGAGLKYPTMRVFNAGVQITL